MSELHNAALESLATSLLFGMLAVAVGLMLSRRLQRSISGPIEQLTAAMHDVARTRDYSTNMTPVNTHELAKLVESFNTMLGEIRTRDSALAGHRDQLEVEVLDRTRELVQAKAVADAANAAKSDFLATMSHEIRTPMNGMLVMAELMAAGDLPPRLQRYADVLVNSGQSLLAIINDILDLSKIEAGRLEVETVPLDPAAIVDNVLNLFHERALSKSVDLVSHVAPDVPALVSGDPVRLNQVLTNLINNALKFTETGSVIVRLSCRFIAQTGKTELKISVTDTGIGLSPAQIARIFEPFEQADKSTTRRFGGTGIGLTICRRIVAAMNGDIEVTSEPGRGSTFTLRVSLDVVEPAAPRLRASMTEPRRVFVALPASATRNLLCEYLAEFGLEADIAEPANLGTLDLKGVCGVIAKASDLQVVQPMPAAILDNGRQAVVLALTTLGESGAHSLLRTGAADLLLSLPWATDELRNSLGAICRGRPSIALDALQPTPRRTIERSDPRRFAGIHVLAADDSPTNREILNEALTRLHVRVTSVCNGQEALAAVKAGAFDLVFMDGSMPVMDGFTAARAIRDWESETNRPAIPVVALTAHVVGRQAEQWRASGMSDCVTKPFSLKSLEACLKHWVKPVATGERVALTQETVVAPMMEQLSVSTAVALVDPAVLDNIRMMQRPGDDLVSRVVRLYGLHAPQAMLTLRGLANSRSLLDLADAAHALKSLSRNVGARRVGDLCDQLETAARNNTVIEPERDCAAIEQALADTLVAFENMRAITKAA